MRFLIINEGGLVIVRTLHLDDFMICLNALEERYDDSNFIAKAICPFCEKETLISLGDEIYDCEWCLTRFDNLGNIYKEEE